MVNWAFVHFAHEKQRVLIFLEECTDLGRGSPFFTPQGPNYQNIRQRNCSEYSGEGNLYSQPTADSPRISPSSKQRRGLAKNSSSFF